MGGTWTRECVFTTTTGTPIRASNFLRRSFKPKMREVVPDRSVTFHHFRHTYASFLAEMGLDLLEIKNILDAVWIEMCRLHNGCSIHGWSRSGTHASAALGSRQDGLASGITSATSVRGVE